MALRKLARNAVVSQLHNSSIINNGMDIIRDVPKNRTTISNLLGLLTLIYRLLLVFLCYACIKMHNNKQSYDSYESGHAIKQVLNVPHDYVA